MGLWSLAFCWGFILVSLYGIAAGLQWRERSLENLVVALREQIPPGSKVATEPGAYFALLENGCAPWYTRLKLSGYRDALFQPAYQENLVRAGVTYLLLHHGTVPAAAWHFKPERLRFQATVGCDRPTLFFASDQSYWFDVYRIE
jgi:hypothetical protein